LPTIEERVSFLEGQLSEQSHTLQELRGDIQRLEARMDARFEAVDRHFDAVDRRFEAIGGRFDAVDRRFEGLGGKMSTQFLWLVGIQVTMLVAIVGALLTRG